MSTVILNVLNTQIVYVACFYIQYVLIGLVDSIYEAHRHRYIYIQCSQCKQYHKQFKPFSYLLQERARAAALGYPDPTNPTYEATSDMYHRTFTECLKRIKDLKEHGQPNKIGIMVASHNENTVRFALDR